MDDLSKIVVFIDEETIEPEEIVEEIEDQEYEEKQGTDQGI